MDIRVAFLFLSFLILVAWVASDWASVPILGKVFRNHNTALYVTLSVALCVLLSARVVPYTYDDLPYMANLDAAHDQLERIASFESYYSWLLEEPLYWLFISVVEPFISTGEGFVRVLIAVASAILLIGYGVNRSNRWFFLAYFVTSAWMVDM